MEVMICSEISFYQVAEFKNEFSEFPLWLIGLRTQHSVCEDAGLIPGLTEWVKELALPQGAT